MTTLTPTGSLTALMNEIVALEEIVDPDTLVVYRWRPLNFPDVEMGGAIYNWLAPSPPLTRFDNVNARDIVTILCRVAVRHTDVSEEMAALEGYADLLRDVIDDHLYKNQPLHGTVRRANRNGMRLLEDTFNNISALAIEFPLECEFTRRIPGLV